MRLRVVVAVVVGSLRVGCTDVLVCSVLKHYCNQTDKLL